MILGFYLWRLISAIVTTLPTSLANRMARGIGVLVYYVWFTRRQVARENFSRVLARPVDDPLVGRVARRAFSGYCVYLLEMMRYPRISLEEMRARVQIEEDSVLQELLARDQPLIVVSAHFGNMDYAAAVAAERYRRFTLAAETIKPIQLFEYLARVRSERGADLVPYDRAPRKIIQAIKQKQIVGFLIDFGINAQRDMNTTEVTFFGERTRFPSSPAILAQRFGAPLVVASTPIGKDGRIHVHIEPPIHLPHAMPREQAEREGMQRVAESLEKCIRAHPDQWYVFRPIWPTRAARPPLLKRLTAAFSD